LKNLTAKPFLLSCGARAMPKSPFGTSFVMTDPEAVIALSPTRTGATKELLEPINALSPISVKCFETPS